MLDQGKLLMFRNRLEKMFRHRSRQARRMNVSCYRVYDHDLPEFPFCIEFYGEHLYVAEYQRHHGMDEEQHQLWLKESMDCIAEVLGVAHEQIFLRERKKCHTATANMKSWIAGNIFSQLRKTAYSFR